MSFRGHNEHKGDSELRGRLCHTGHTGHAGHAGHIGHSQYVENCMDGDFGLHLDDVMMSGDNNIVVKTYPSFLKPYLNKVQDLPLFPKTYTYYTLILMSFYPFPLNFRQKKPKKLYLTKIDLPPCSNPL